MKNYVQEGKTLTVVAPYSLQSGGGALIGGIFGVAAESAPIGGSVDLTVAGVFYLPKDASPFTMGQAVYWNDSAQQITATATANTLIGVAIQPAASAALTATVRLNGSFQ